MKTRSIQRSILCGLICTLLLAPAVAIADSWSFVGSRHQAMGGTGVAFSDDSTSAYWNPANFAWQKGWDVQIPITLDANVENQAIQGISNLIVTAADLEQDIEDFLNCPLGCSGTPPSGQAREELMGFLLQLATYGQNGEAVHANLSIGLSGRYNSMGFSALSLTTATVFPNVDLENVGLSSVDFDVIIGTGQVPVDSGLAAQISARADVTLLPQQVQQLVWLAELAGGNTSDPRIRSFLGTLAANTSQDTNPFASNDTGALTAGVSTQEFGFSYAHKIPLPFHSRTGRAGRSILRYLDNRTSLGVTLKYMLGITFLKTFQYADTDSTGDIFGEWIDSGDSEFSHNFGLDLGFSWRPLDFVNVGLVARNVNSPAFDIAPFISPTTGQYVTEVELDAQVRMGVALIPIRHLTLAMDIDLTENQIKTLPGFRSRILSLGAEYDLPIGKNFGLALRVGGYNNLSGSVNQDWAITAGLGLRVGLFQLDASLGSSFDDEIIRTDTYTYTTLPTRFNVGLGLKFEKSF
ncbi:MAG: conjugal transfer protein TraF [Deltaproteobacteria bacterium]|nr:conjugal transfer protein TraF [Deltaproteobacteria bacterium]